MFYTTMPANNNRAKKDKTLLSEGAQAPAQINKKTLQDALVDGYEDISTFARDFLDVDPYEEQETFFTGARDAVEANLSAGNRTGKTHGAGVGLLWKATYRHVPSYTRPERRSHHITYKAVSTSLTLDQATIAWNYAMTYAESPRFRPFFAGEPIRSPWPVAKLRVKDERGEWVFSEIWARSLAKGGKYILGHPLGFVLVDEYAFIPSIEKIEDEVIRMRLADNGGAIWRISSPNGRNHFHTQYLKGKAGDPRYFSLSIPTTANPYVSKRYIEEMRERMSPEYFAQNVMAEFVAIGDFFSAHHIQRLYEDVEGAIGDGFNEEPDPAGSYVMGVDLGAKRDPTVIYILRLDVDKDELPRIVYAREVRNRSWAASREAVKQAWRAYKPDRTYIDATGVGAPVAQQLVEEDGLLDVEQFVLSHSSKPETMTKLQDAIERRKFVFPFCRATQELVSQLSFYKLDDKEIRQDHVIALALMNLALEDVRRYGKHTQQQIEDDVMVVPVSQGRYAPEDMFDDMEGGLSFRIDPRTGLLIPNGSTYGII